jgi:hypothetical protein
MENSFFSKRKWKQRSVGIDESSENRIKSVENVKNETSE